MGFNLGNFLRGIRDDINPFDGGKSHGNPQGRPRPASTARPQQRPQNRGGLSVQPVQQAQLAPPPPKALYEQALNAPKPLAVQPVQTPKLTIAAPQPQKPLSVGVAKPQNLQIGNTVIAPSQTQRTQTVNRTKFLEQQQNPSLLDQALKTPVGGALKTASYVPGSFKDALQTVGTGIVKSGIDTAKLPYEATRLLAAEATQNDEAITNATKALHEKALGSWIAPLAQTAVLGGSTLAANELMNNTNTDEQTKQNQLQYVNEALAPIGFNLGDTQKQTNLKGASLIAQDIAVPVLSKGGNAALKSVTTGGKEAIAKGVTTKLATGQLKPVSQSLAETKGAITNTGVQLAKVTTSLVDKTKLAMPKPLNEGGYIRVPNNASDELVKNVYRKGTDANALYHGTKYDNALEILKTGKIKASKPNANRDLIPDNPNAQVSLSRQRNSGFYNSASADVKFVVDKSKVGKTRQYVDGELSPSDYKNPRVFEAEEQTRKDIPLTNIKRIEGGALLEPADEKALRALATKQGIPFVAFDDVKGMRNVLPTQPTKNKLGLKKLNEGGYAKMPGKVTVYRGGGKEKKVVSKRGISVFGNDLKYYAKNEKTAKKFGENISKTTLSYKKPLVLDNDKTFWDFRKRSGYDDIPMSTWGKERKILEADVMRKQLDKEGYDLVDVRLDKTPNTRALKNVFGDDQIIPLTKLDEKGGIQLPFGKSKVNQVTAPGYTKTSGKRDSVLKKLNEGGTLGDNNQPTIKNIFGEEVPNPAYKGVDPLDSLRQEASKYKSAEEFVKAQTNLYHGTKADFSEFDPNLLGTNTGAPSAKKGFFFTDNEQLANHYANPGRNQGTAISKNLEDAMGRAVERAKKEGLDNSLSNNTGGAMVVGSWPKTAKATEVKSSILSKMETLKSRFDSPEDIKKINRFQQLVTEELDNTKLTDLELSGKVLKSKVNLENPMVFDDNGLRNGASYAKRIDEAIAKGHDGVIIKNTQDPFRGDIHVAFDKNQILTEKQLTDLYNQAQPTKNKLGLKKLNEGGYIRIPGGKQVDDTLYHGSPNADEIAKKGFSSNKKANGQTYGNGVYLAEDKLAGKIYGGPDGKMVETKINPNAKILDIPSKDIQDNLFGKDTNHGDSALITKKFQEQGYDGLRIGAGETHPELVVFNPKNVNKGKSTMWSGGFKPKPLGEEGFARIPGKGPKKEAPIVGPSLSRSKKSSLEPIIPRDAVKTPEQGIQDAIKTAEGKPPKEAKAKLLDSANNSEVIPKDIVEAIDPTRSIKTNTESWNNAGKILYENGDDGALKYFHENHSAESTAVGWRLFNKRLSNNDKPGAQELLADMTARSIENGQATQAWAMIKRLDPTYIVAKLDREVTRFSNKTSNTLKKRIDWDADKQARIMQYSKWLGDDGLITKLTKMDDNAAISKATGITDKGTLKGLARTTDPERVKMYLTNNLNKEINSIIPSTAGDKAISYWKSGLLSAPVTHVRNIVGNTMNAAANVIETPIAGAFDATVGRVLTPTKRTISANPVTGMGRGLKKGGRDFADAIETGITADDVSKYNYKTVNWNLNNPAEKYVFKPFSDAIFRTLGAEDKIFKSPGVLTSLYNQADAAAISAGKRGDAKWMADWIENSPPIVKETAKKEGGAWVFQKDTVVSTGMKGLRNSIKRSHPGYEKIVEAIQPFVNVPAAIGSELMTYTPAGLLRVANKSRKAIDKNIDLTARDLYRRQAMKDLSKTSVGVGILTAGFAMGLSGDASGNMPPKNSREYDQWVLENRQPNSIKVGGKWFNINSVGPQLTLFNAAAQTGAQMRRDKNKGKNSSPIDNAIAFGGNVGTNFLNSSSLTGATDATNALKDPARYGTNYVARQGTSFIPNFAKRAGSGFDPYQHDPQNFKEAVQAQIPGARNKLAAKTDVTGAKVPNNQHGPLAAKALFDPFNVSKSKSSALANSLADEINTDAKNKLAKDEAKKQIDGGKTTSKKPSNSGDGKVVEASNGKVVAKIDGEYKTFNNKQEAKNAVDKKNFEKSNKSYQVIGETVYTKNSQGKVSETPKSVYDYKVGSETLTMQKNSGDVAGWLDTADKQMKNIEQRLKDKNIDPLDAISLKNDAAALQKNINKYAGYGGFTKPKKGKVAKGRKGGKGGKGKSSGGLDYTKMLAVKSGFGSSTALRNIVTKTRIKKGKK